MPTIKIEPAGTIESSIHINNYHISLHPVTRESTYNQGHTRFTKESVTTNALVYLNFITDYLKSGTFKIKHGYGVDERTIYINNNDFLLRIPVLEEGNAMVYNHNNGGSVNRCSYINISGTKNTNMYEFYHLTGTAAGNTLYDTAMRLRQEEERRNFINLELQQREIFSEIVQNTNEAYESRHTYEQYMGESLDETINNNNRRN